MLTKVSESSPPISSKPLAAILTSAPTDLPATPTILPAVLRGAPRTLAIMFGFLRVFDCASVIFFGNSTTQSPFLISKNLTFTYPGLLIPGLLISITSPLTIELTGN